jgi:phosphoglycolate phosphatase
MTEQQICPLCGGTAFEPIPQRDGHYKCKRCGSLPRTRLLGLAVIRAAPAISRQPVVHLAPERGLAHVFRSKYGETWLPADIDTSRYQASWVSRDVMYADLTQVPKYFPVRSVHGFIHSHVLEHLPADISRILEEMNAAIAPGGFQAMVVPIQGQRYEEDLSEGLTDEDRLRRFGHTGHVRNFGRADFQKRVLSHFDGWTHVNLRELISDRELLASAIPGNVLTDLTGSTVFLFIKPAR